MPIAKSTVLKLPTELRSSYFKTYLKLLTLLMPALRPPTRPDFTACVVLGIALIPSFYYPKDLQKKQFYPLPLKRINSECAVQFHTLIFFCGRKRVKYTTSMFWLCHVFSNLILPIPEGEQFYPNFIYDDMEVW